ncbi:putative C6 transcription factor [Aspergillus chevalieri]|uniref:Xylanolytic transcriptional activator regulatory domain-containing protein n=1 Tax=Aspergillus chevalieri TaxID=182096 RepID=A0A7R7VTM6_ASPCH|nr:uncharacterized protein ACHE_51131S [Aspergillus chevalieri]BCR89933.1 hypothetical protein ACHE_51131S [Aspergillus chevalieri]
MTAMQEQIALLSSAVYSLTNATGIPRPDTTTQTQPQPQTWTRRLSSAKEALTFQGPTTSAFSFDLAKSSLQQRGIVGVVDGDDEDADGDLTQEPSPMPSPPSPTRDSVDPLWTIGKSEALRLCRVYEEEMGIMYPVLEVEELLGQVNVLYGDGGLEGGGLEEEDVHVLRIVLACALAAEASGGSELAVRLFESVRVVADDCVWGAPDINRIIFLTLVSIFYFQMDEETLAWRTIGIVERMCLETGLHRRETLDQPSLVASAGSKDRLSRLFWSVYILDLRWSFGTGMPFSLEESDIDPWLPEPEEKNFPYLRVMIRYSRIAAKVWKLIAAFNNTDEIKKDEMNYLDWQVLRWAETMPECLRLNGHQDEPRSLRRLRSVLYLRANQLRMLIHRPVLHTAAHIRRYPAESATVVDLAKDTIRFIARLHETSDIYSRQQVTFNWFLVSALAVLFLAAAQAPGQFNRGCKEEFYMALELVKGFSTQSYISQRLWKSIKSLRKLGPQLGLSHEHQQQQQQHQGDNTLDDVPASSTVHTTPLDGTQMTQELMEWFETVGNLDTLMAMGIPGTNTGVEDGLAMLDYGGELSSVMKDCF